MTLRIETTPRFGAAHDAYDVCLCARGAPAVFARLTPVDGTFRADVDWPHAPPHLAALFATTDALDPDGLVSCSPVGSARLGAPGEARWRDVDGGDQGGLRVTPPPPAPPADDARPHCRRLIRADSDWYARAARGAFNAERQVFYSVATCVGELPLLALPVASTGAAGDAFLRRCLALACALSGVPEAALDPEAHAEVFAMAVTLPSGAQLYVNDFARGAAARDTEEWSALLAYPDPLAAAFDCEDGALQIQALVHAHQATESADPLLRLARRFWTAYTCCSLQGDLRAGGWVAHAYCACFDARAVDRWLGAAPPGPPADPRPTLVLESTAWQTAVWSRAAFRDAPPRPAPDWLRGAPLLQRCCRPLVGAREASHLYGAVAKLQAARHRGRALAFAVVDAAGAMSVRLEALACEPWAAAPRLLAECPTAELRRELEALPPWRLPDAPADAPADAAPAPGGLVQVRARDWPRVREAAAAALAGRPVLLADVTLSATGGFVCLRLP